MKGLIKCLKFLKPYIFIMSLSLLMLFIIESIWRGSLVEGLKFLTINYLISGANLIILMLIFSISLLTKRKRTVVFFLSILLITISIINKLVLLYRGTPFTINDVFSIKEALTISKNYFSWMNILFTIISIILIVIGIVILSRKEKLNNSNLSKFTLICVVLLWGLGICIIKVIEPIALIKNEFIEKVSYYDNGLIYSFINSNFGIKYKKPLNYNEENLELLNSYLEKNTESIINNDYNLNIILVQLESFFDPMSLKEINFINDPIPTFRNLITNYSSGLISVPTFGGGTVRTEFEVLTSTNLDYFSPNEIPNNTIGKKLKSIPSISQYFNSLDYETTAFHNNTEYFFNRKMIFSKMMFDKFFGAESMSNLRLTEEKFYYDLDLVPYIKDRIEQTTGKDFIEAITVQLHGPYNKKTTMTDNIFTDNQKVGIQYDELNNYLQRINYVDQFIAELINTVNSLNEDFVVVFYSDHYPNLSILNDDKHFDLDKYQVPYVIYDNIGLPKNNKDLESYQLSSYLIDLLNYPQNNLQILHNKFSNEDWYQEALEILQYDILFNQKNN